MILSTSPTSNQIVWKPFIQKHSLQRNSEMSNIFSSQPVAETEMYNGKPKNRANWFDFVYLESFVRF